MSVTLLQKFLAALTFLERTKTVCFFVAAMAATTAEPMLPLPPATATVTMIVAFCN